MAVILFVWLDFLLRRDFSSISSPKLNFTACVLQVSLGGCIPNLSSYHPSVVSLLCWTKTLNSCLYQASPSFYLDVDGVPGVAATQKSLSSPQVRRRGSRANYSGTDSPNSGQIGYPQCSFYPQDFLMVRLRSACGSLWLTALPDFRKVNS